MANNHIIRKKRKTIIESTAPEVETFWPSWRYHPKTGKGKIFNDEDEVPNGWVEHFAESQKGKQELKSAEDDDDDDMSVNTNERLTGAGGQELDPTDNLEQEPAALEDISDIDVPTIKARLKRREVPFAANASKTNLYQLLEENWEVED